MRGYLILAAFICASLANPLTKDNDHKHPHGSFAGGNDMAQEETHHRVRRHAPTESELNPNDMNGDEDYFRDAKAPEASYTRVKRGLLCILEDCTPQVQSVPASPQRIDEAPTNNATQSTADSSDNTTSTAQPPPGTSSPAPSPDTEIKQAESPVANDTGSNSGPTAPVSDKVDTESDSGTVSGDAPAVSDPSSDSPSPVPDVSASQDAPAPVEEVVVENSPPAPEVPTNSSDPVDPTNDNTDVVPNLQTKREANDKHSKNDNLVVPVDTQPKDDTVEPAGIPAPEEAPVASDTNTGDTGNTTSSVAPPANNQMSDAEILMNDFKRVEQTKETTNGTSGNTMMFFFM